MNVDQLELPKLKAYLKNPHKCPYCKSEDIEGEGVEVSVDQQREGIATQEVSCRQCCAVWTDEYKLVGLTVHYPPQE